VLDCVKNLQVLNGVASLVADCAAGSETTCLFPAAKSFGGEGEFFGYFGDGVKLFGIHKNSIHKLYIIWSVQV